ncbi:hypothetical protein pipiens_016186 [Culex pipiens pipiens]|uniref:Uncharacterized protein n=1 Tax=Culex pipiens pipiens TaxID=38569 RepID=A0ABD1CMC7_CULPP
MRHIQDHETTPIDLSWPKAAQLLKIFRPHVLPQFNSYKIDSISTDMETLLQQFSPRQLSSGSVVHVYDLRVCDVRQRVCGQVWCGERFARAGRRLGREGRPENSAVETERHVSARFLGHHQRTNRAQERHTLAWTNASVLRIGLSHAEDRQQQTKDHHSPTATRRQRTEGRIPQNSTKAHFKQGFNWRVHEELGIRYCPAGLQLAGARRTAESGTAQQGFNWRANEGVRNQVLPSRASTGGRTKDCGIRYCPAGLQLAGERRSAESGTAQQGFNWLAHEGHRSPTLYERCVERAAFEEPRCCSVGMRGAVRRTSGAAKKKTRT